MQKEEINCGMLYEVDEKIIKKSAQMSPNVWKLYAIDY